MANKWQIELFVNETEVQVLVTLLEDEVRVLQEGLELIADEEEYDSVSTHIASLRDLKAQVKLSWIEREEELIPPPSEWSEDCPVVYVHTIPF